MMTPNTPPEGNKPSLEQMIGELKTLLGPNNVGMMISNKWIGAEEPTEYFILSLSTQSLRLLERTDTTKNEYELSLKTQTLKFNNQEKDRNFALSFFDKVDRLTALLATNEAQLFFKAREEAK